MLSAGHGSSTSLGYPGAKYEMGLEAIEQIEVIAAELVAEVFSARYAEVRVPSGAIANLYAFMATCRARGTPSSLRRPASGARHATTRQAAPPDVPPENHPGTSRPRSSSPSTWTRCAALARDLGPKLITIGASLNLYPHPASELRARSL